MAIAQLDIGLTNDVSATVTVAVGGAIGTSAVRVLIDDALADRAKAITALQIIIDHLIEQNWPIV